MFANFGEPKDYGFDTHYAVYECLSEGHTLIANAGADNEELYLVTRYEGEHIPDLLEETFGYIEYLIKGLKEYNVEIPVH